MSIPASTPFDQFHTRSLFGWPLLAGLVAVCAVMGATEWRPLAPARDVFLEFTLYGVLAAWVLAQCRHHHIRLRRLVGKPPRERRDWGLVMLALPLAATALGAIFLVYYPLSFLAPAFVETYLLDDSSTFTPGAPFLNFCEALTAVIVAPVVEEVIFRGLLVHRWARKWGAWRAALAVSLAFAVLHADLLGAFIFGLVMTLLYLRTRTLLVPMACHALHNALVMAVALIGSDDAKTPPAQALAEFRSLWWLGLVCLTIGLPCLWAFARKNWNWPGSAWHLPYFD